MAKKKEQKAPESVEQQTAAPVHSHKSDAEVTIEQKLIALYSLQKIDSKIDKIRIVRGELPLEVQDLEDEIIGLETRISNFNDEITNQKDQILKRKIRLRTRKAS